MSNVHDLVGNLAELFTWIGLSLGVVLFLVVLVMRIARGGWVETDAVVVDDFGTPQLRWMTTEGELHTRHLDAEENDAITDPDELHVHYNKHAPQHVRFEAAGHGEKVVRALAFILTGIGALAAVVSLVLLFVPQ
ncbi:MAG: hypothetical protein JWQ43_2499 [Glaciihabitans sp.]|nr:hypothetical protein [Glaciihabitans sp.]